MSAYLVAAADLILDFRRQDSSVLALLMSTKQHLPYTQITLMVRRTTLTSLMDNYQRDYPSKLMS